MIDIVSKVNNVMLEGAPLWDVIDACSVIDIEACFDPIFEPLKSTRRLNICLICNRIKQLPFSTEKLVF